MTDLRDLMPGDQVTIKDRHGNLITGEVEHIGTDWVIDAFNTAIEFARDRPHGPVQIAGIKVIEWTTQLTNLEG